MNSPALPLALYLLLTAFVGWYVGRRSEQNIQTYYVANRSLGGFVLAMTLVATYTSASSFIGGPGIASQVGLSWVYLAMIQIPTAWLTLGVLGRRFVRVGIATKSVTVTGFLCHRYHSPAVAALSSCALLIFFLAAMTAQFVGGARLFQAATGLNYLISLTLFAGTVIFYTAFGGARAVALTDALQGVVMVCGTVLLLWATVKAGGGWANLFDKLEALDPGLISPTGPAHAVPWSRLSSFWVLVCFGVIGLPHTASRCLTYRDSRAMHKAMITSTLTLSLILFGMTLCGAFSRLLLHNVEPDLMMPTLAKTLLHPVASGIFLAGPLASMMSTLDSQLLQMAATVTQDVSGLFSGGEKFAKNTKIAGYITFCLGLITFILALNPPQLLVWLNLFAFGGLESCFFWPLVLGLYWRTASKQGALISMIIGLLTYLIFYFNPVGAIHPVVFSLTFSGLAFWCTSTFFAPESHDVTIFFDNL